jgi:hypothetical protein
MQLYIYIYIYIYIFYCRCPFYSVPRVGSCHGMPSSMQCIRATKLPYSVRRYGRALFILKLLGHEITSAVNTEMLHELMTSSKLIFKL